MISFRAYFQFINKYIYFNKLHTLSLISNNAIPVSIDRSTEHIYFWYIKYILLMIKIYFSEVNLSNNLKQVMY